MTFVGAIEVSGEAQPADIAVARSTPHYRPDIDGLRAIAVVSVIMVHAQVTGFSGGFVGVDIFFVISGYLIYGDLVRRAAQGRLSLLGFYGRRMRRTMPALYLVAGATLAGAACVMLPGDLDEMARSLLATLALVPNIFFLTQAGYFDAAASAKPLLHAWSLGVEEQFYLVAPLLPLALMRLGRGSRQVALLVLFLIALVGAITLRQVAQAAAFYLMPARIFEFLVGALLVEGLVPKIRSPWLAEFASIIALTAVAGSIVTFSDATPHPGIATLVPCLATAALIHIGSTRRTFVGTLLGLRGPAFIGLISYSLYLWHWPILVLSRMADVTPTPGVFLTQVSALFLLSVLSWRFVETPFRAVGSIWRRRAPVAIPASAVALASTAFAIILLHGLPQRFPPDVASVASYYAYRDQRPFREGQCFITSKNRLSDYDRATCLKISPDRPNVLIIGDSHAAHLWSGLRDTWPGVNFLQATASGCKPVIGTQGSSRCTVMMAEMFDNFIPTHRLDAIVIGGLWDPQDIAPLKATINEVAQKAGKVVTFGPLPRYDTPASTLLAKAMLKGDLNLMRAHLLPEPLLLDQAMRTAISPVATYVSPYQILCGQGPCRLFAAPGVPMQFDYHHLTPQGADVMMGAVRADYPHLFEIGHRSTSNR